MPRFHMAIKSSDCFFDHRTPRTFGVALGGRGPRGDRRGPKAADVIVSGITYKFKAGAIRARLNDVLLCASYGGNRLTLRYVRPRRLHGLFRDGGNGDARVETRQNDPADGFRDCQKSTIHDTDGVVVRLRCL